MQSHVSLWKIVILCYTRHRLVCDRNVQMVTAVYT